MFSADFGAYIDDRPKEGVFRVHRSLMTDPDLFDLEMRYIWEGTWIFLGLESQLPKPNDFLTTWIGRQPVVVVRDGSGAINAFINTCRHRGARLCATEKGNRKHLVCPYHGWAWDTAGNIVDIKDRRDGGYTAAFDQEDHNLMRVPRFETYKGLMFGSINPDVPDLMGFLGEARHFVDLIMDQGPHGMEFVPGRMRYIYHGNWKWQAENNLDNYHLTSTHPSFVEVVKMRQQGESGNKQVKSVDFLARAQKDAGMFEYENGHASIWVHNPNPQDRPLYSSIDEVRSRVGELRTEWMFHLRNTLIYPSVQLADTSGLIIRKIRPLAVDKTEISIYCLAPVGEDPKVRTWRIRQHEDFFGASGLANPDDSVTYEDGQIGSSASLPSWHQGYARGQAFLTEGADEVAEKLGIKPVRSLKGPFAIQAETPFHSGNRQWLRLMKSGAARDAGK